MSTIVYRISVLLGVILADVPVGTNLGLFWLLWALSSGRFLLSRGAVFPALADGGLPADAVRRSGAALAYYYFVSLDLHEVSSDKKGGYPWIYTPVQPRCPSWTSFWPPSRCASVARRARPPWSAT